MRYLPHTETEIVEMLDVVGLTSLDELFEPVPEHLRLTRALAVPDALGEIELDQHLKELADRNHIRREKPAFLGAGLYEHYVPHVVRQLILRSEFLTSYTPYQPEISQGTLKTIFEYQSMMASLLGLDIANASMYDGAQASAEGALMALRQTRKSRALASAAVHPEYTQVMRTYMGNSAEIGPLLPIDGSGCTDLMALDAALEQGGVGAVVIQSPNFFGCVEPVAAISERCEKHGAMLVVAFNEPLAYALLKPPGECGADIAVGEAISFGNAIGLGGPSLGVFATNKRFVRQMPGRLAGRTVDSQGREGYVLTLSTREQHIRRERATSNICTNQGLCATSAAIYMALLGKQGLTKLARVNLARAEYAKKQLLAIDGITLTYGAPTFNEFCLTLPCAASELRDKCAESGVLIGVPISDFDPHRTNGLLVAVTEMHTVRTIDRLVALVAETINAR